MSDAPALPCDAGCTHPLARAAAFELAPTGAMRAAQHALPPNDDQVLLYDGPRPLQPGWIEIVLSGLATAQPADLALQLTHPGGEEDGVSYSLPPATRSGDMRVVLRADRPIARIKLMASEGVPLRVAWGQARPLSRLATLGRALQRAPLPTIAAGYWRLVGKKLRARNRLSRILSPPSPIDYGAWLTAHEPAWMAEIPSLMAALEQTGRHVRIGIFVAVDRDEPVCPETLASVAAQPGPPWRLLIDAPGHHRDVGPLGLPPERCAFLAEPRPRSLAARLNAAMVALAADWVLVLRNGDRLAAGALARIAAAASAHADAAAVYGDHDLLHRRGRRQQPSFKPKWNRPLFIAYDYVGMVAFRCLAALDVGAFRGDHPGLEVDDLLMRLAAAKGNKSIVHIPRILHHRRQPALGGQDPGRLAADRGRMVAAHLVRENAGVCAETDRFGHVRVRYRLVEPAPLVSLIVPTRDRLDLLRPCIEGLRQTEYPALEIIVADNGSRRADTRRYLHSLRGDSRLRVLPVPGQFNYAAINNKAVQAARGSVVGFINNDVEVVERAWLADMVAYAMQPGIGAVGCKLLYTEGSIQHAGVVLGLQGLAGHAHRFHPSEHLGYMRRLQASQDIAAVTAACLILEKRKFEQAGGFDEIAFPIAFNDVDLCLRLRGCGYENFYTPYAVLYHRESASRTRDARRPRRAAYAREAGILRHRWGPVLDDDPYYSPHLTRTKEDFSLL